MMIATERARSESSDSSSGGRVVQSERMRVSKFKEAAASDFHDLCFFSLQELVDLVRVLVGELLDAILGAVLLVDAHLARTDELLQVMHDVAADVADGDAPLLGEVAHDLHELLAPLLGQLRDGEP